MNFVEQKDYHRQEAIAYRFQEQNSRAIRDLGRLGMGLGVSGLFYAGYISESPTPGRIFEATMSAIIFTCGAFLTRKGQNSAAESCVNAASHEVAAGILMSQLPIEPNGSPEQ